MVIQEYSNSFQDDVIQLILSVQRDEMGVEITIKDQPDLLSINDIYLRGNGNFWMAVSDEKVIGTIGLIDIGQGEMALRKMFVHQDWRGSGKGTAQTLMNTVFQWCRDHAIHTIYLGTIEIMKAAHRFYEKNGFHRLPKNELPQNFQPMKVDNVFYRYTFNEKL